MITGFWGYDDTCKTLNAVTFFKYMAKTRQYEKKYSNISVVNEEYMFLTTANVRLLMKKLIPSELKNRLILIDECDVIFPADEYTNKDDKESMRFAYQTHKLNTDIIYVSHRGKGVNKLLRQATHRLVVCHKDEQGKYYVCMDDLQRNGLESPIIYERINPELTFKDYDRWEVVKP